MQKKYICSKYNTYEELSGEMEKCSGLKIFGNPDYLNNTHKMVTFTGNNLAFGLTYYNLGLKPQIIFINIRDKSQIVLGFDKNIIWIDYDNKTIIEEFAIFSLFYEFIFVHFLNIVVAICELDIVAFDRNANIIWRLELRDIIQHYNIINNENLHIECANGEQITLYIKNGKIIL